MVFVEILLFFFAFFEVYYFVRFFILAVYLKVMQSKGKLNKSPFEEGIVYGLCTTTDLDFNLHMSNSRYLREMDFGRVLFVVRNGIFSALREKGGNMAFAASTIRYRRSVTLFQAFKLRTKVIYWDDRNIYMEQRLVTIHDRFTRAIAYAKVVVVNYPSVSDLFKALGHPEVTPPAPPPDLVPWLEYNNLSSQILQKERQMNGNESRENGEATKTNEANVCTSEINTDLKLD